MTECLDCIQADKCTTCESNRSSDYIDNGLCPCPDGEYDPGDGSCLTCSVECATCYDETGECKTCASDRNNDPSDCTCLDGTYEDDDGVCQSCNLDVCDTCEGSPTTCNVCDELRVQNPPTCDCQPGQFREDDESCTDCELPCDECLTSALDCTTCSGIRELVVHDDVDTVNECVCPSHYFENPDTLLCDECDTACEECSLSSTNCDPCASDRESGSEPDCPCPSH